jgi:RNase P/RNase MRP subunit POP5
MEASVPLDDLQVKNCISTGLRTNFGLFAHTCHVDLLHFDTKTKVGYLRTWHSFSHMLLASLPITSVYAGQNLTVRVLAQSPFLPCVAQ